MKIDGRISIEMKARYGGVLRGRGGDHTWYCLGIVRKGYIGTVSARLATLRKRAIGAHMVILAERSTQCSGHDCVGARVPRKSVRPAARSRLRQIPVAVCYPDGRISTGFARRTGENLFDICLELRKGAGQVSFKICTQNHWTRARVIRSRPDSFLVEALFEVHSARPRSGEAEMEKICRHLCGEHNVPQMGYKANSVCSA